MGYNIRSDIQNSKAAAFSWFHTGPSLLSDVFQMCLWGVVGWCYLMNCS